MRHSAKAAHTGHLETLEQYIGELQELLEQERRIATPNWGDVGSMGRNVDLIAQVTDQFKRRGEYA